MTRWRSGKPIGAPPGEMHPKAKLSKPDIQHIRTLYHLGLSIKDIAEKYETHYNTIHDIIKYRRRTYD